MDFSRRCMVLRKTLLLTLLCCSAACYTWHILANYPVIADWEQTLVGRKGAEPYARQVQAYRISHFNKGQGFRTSVYAKDVQDFRTIKSKGELVYRTADAKEVQAFKTSVAKEVQAFMPSVVKEVQALRTPEGKGELVHRTSDAKEVQAFRQNQLSYVASSAKEVHNSRTSNGTEGQVTGTASGLKKLQSFNGPLQDVISNAQSETLHRPERWTGDYSIKTWLPRSIKADAPEVAASSLSFNVSNDMLRFSGGAPVKRLPQALIIGVKKCGTRALLEFLRLHPDIRATGPETHFFDRFYNRGLEWYRQQMPLSLDSQITMEKTPSYFITREVPHRLHQMSPSVKLIVVVRDPVTRAISDYTQTASKRGRTVPLSFDRMTFRNSSTGLVDTSWSAIRIGVYSRFLEWWTKYFKLNQIHFVSGENLIRDPAEEMARVQDFLELKRVITDKHFYFNETKGFPCLKKSEGNGNPHCLGKTKGRTHPEISPSTITRLRDFYRPFNMRFYQMVGRDFGWL